MMPKLPYKNIGGIVPCPGGWVIVPARLAGVTVTAEEALVVATLDEVLNFRPKFDAAAIHCPIGFADAPAGKFRQCDDDARAIIGWPRSVGVRPIPCRAALRAPTRDAARAIEPWLTNDDLRKFRWWREAERDIQPFHQRSLFSANPDLSFTQLNDDEPLRSSPYQTAGLHERINLIRSKLPGVEDIVLRIPPPGAAQVHVLQAVGLLWTARRAAARAILRLPLDPTWDTQGIRMELVR